MFLQEEYEAKFKNQEKDGKNYRKKEMQEMLKKKLLDQEAKLKRAWKTLCSELSQKENVHQIFEMAQANSAGNQ